MQRRNVLAGLAWLGLVPPSAATAQPAQRTPVRLAPCGAPHGGLGPFDRDLPADLRPALQQAITLYRAELAATSTHNPQPPSVENSVAALEDAGLAYSRLVSLHHVHASTMNGAAMQQIERDTAPLLAAVNDEVTQDVALYRCIQPMAAQRSGAG